MTPQGMYGNKYDRGQLVLQKDFTVLTVSLGLTCEVPVSSFAGIRPLFL